MYALYGRTTTLESRFCWLSFRLVAFQVNIQYTADMPKKKPPADATMARVRALFEKSGLTLVELGTRMGYPADTARQSAWQFVAKTEDPRVSTLKRFAQAMGVDAKDLL